MQPVNPTLSNYQPVPQHQMSSGGYLNPSHFQQQDNTVSQGPFMYAPTDNLPSNPPANGYLSPNEFQAPPPPNSYDEGNLVDRISGMSLDSQTKPFAQSQPMNNYQPQTQPNAAPPAGNFMQPMHQFNMPPQSQPTNVYQQPQMNPTNNTYAQHQPMMPPGPALPPLQAQNTSSRPPQSPGMGYPPQAAPMPMGMMPPGPPQMPPGGPSARAPSARAMADSMPSAVDVIENDRSQRSGLFQTGPTGVAPPLATTDFSCRDEGNCNPRFMRSSLYAVPTTSDLLKQTGLPFVLSVQPFANLHPDDEPIILTDMGPQGPVRCVRCKAYMSPSFAFIDGGRRFQCSMCGASTEVPADYFAHLDHTGRRIDAFQRPELCRGTYEVVATKEYCRGSELPLPPAFIFLLDVSQTAVRSGLVQLFCSRFITEVLPRLPRDDQDVASGAVAPDSRSPVSIGFITYDSQLHFYSLVRPSCSHLPGAALEPISKPQMNVVADTAEVFVPTVEGFLVPPDPRILTNLLSTIPSQFTAASLQNGPSAAVAAPDSILGPAIQAGLEALKAANRSGKLFVMQSCLPTAEAPGKLKFRDDKHLIGTDREKTLLQPATDFYTKLGKECVEAGCSVDLFLFPNSFIDVATIAEVPKITSGNVFKYTYFQVDTHGEQFIADLGSAVARPRAFNAILRVRTSTGTRPFEYLGNAHLPNTTDVELAAMDADQAISCEVKYDDNLAENDLVFIQTAVLYTSVGGHRRLRIHNLSLSSSTNAAEVFRLANLDACINWLSKLVVQHALAGKTAAQLAVDTTTKVATALAGYRRLCTGGQGTAASPGELVLPETIKLMPLFAHCILKSDAIRSAKGSSIDDRCYMMFQMNGMGARAISNLLYPRVYALHDLSPETTQLPVPIRCSYERLAPEGVYFIENGIHAFLWCGLKVDPSWIQQVFGVTDVHFLEAEKAVLVEHESPLSKCICRLVLPTLRQFNHFPRLRVIRQNDLPETWVRRCMYEDRDDCGSASYVEYLCHVHKEVRSQLM